MPRSSHFRPMLPTRPPPPRPAAFVRRLATVTVTAVGLALAPPALVAAELLPPPPPGALLSGAARLADGDTLDLTARDGSGTLKVRLWGVDAPEKKQTCRREGEGESDGGLYACGDAATAALASALGDLNDVTCTVKGSDQYGRAVAACAGPSGRDAGRALVEGGWAVDLPQFSKGAHADAEAAAKAARRGVWAGPFLEPAAWRREARIAGLKAAAARGGRPPPPGAPRPGGDGDGDDDATAACRVKGNVSARGARIYYVPGHRLYDRVKINRPDERLFCSVADAEAAGWRAPAS